MAEGENESLVSCLTLFEIERLGLKGTIEKVKTLLESLPAVCRVIWLDYQILSLAARLSDRLNIPAVDSLILAGLVNEKVKVIYTTDSDLEKYARRGVKIKNIKGVRGK